MCAQLLSRAQHFVAPWTVTRRAPLSMAFSRQEYWSRLPFPTPGDLDSGAKPVSLIPPALTGEFFATMPPGKPVYSYMCIIYKLYKKRCCSLINVIFYKEDFPIC